MTPAEKRDILSILIDRRDQDGARNDGWKTETREAGGEASPRSIRNEGSGPSAKKGALMIASEFRLLKIPERLELRPCP
jgi:hypothetical protein